MVSVEQTVTFLEALRSLEGFQVCELIIDDEELDCARESFV